MAKLISLILERLSTSSEELTRGELKQRLIERVERKKEALEAKKQAEDDLKTAGLFGGITDVMLGGVTGQQAEKR